ncbi:MAG: dihydropteroate synthase [Bacteroidales bacterium]|nr:dihydropteroate synthase [Bacteroidales bacterium]
MKTDRHIDIMGIVNLTDDSYFAQSRCGSVDAVLRRTHQMVSDGADIIDVGACSSRPGSAAVGPDVEWSRLRPALEAMRSHFPDVRISVDTYYSSVVERVHDLIGDFIVNDISAGEDDPHMLTTVARLGLEYVAMHKRGNSLTMQSMTDYDDVTDSLVTYFNEFAVRAEEAGVKKWILDPGFGFAKTVEQNYQLLNDLDVIADKVSGSPRILVGVSRKSMIYKPLDLQPDDVLSATQAVHMVSLMKGADILRVHDVKEARQTVRLYQFL